MKKLIKYAALLFALVLAASIIGGCLTLGVSLVQGIQDELSYRTEFTDNENNNLWYRTEEGDIVFLGLQIAESGGKVKSGSEQFTASEIVSLDVNIGSVELTVEPWESNTILVEYENVPVEYKFYVKDKTLVIAQKDNLSFLWNVSFTETSKIHVRVPGSQVFEKITVDKGSGSAMLIDLSVDEINVDNGSGGLSISGVTTQKLTVDSGSGGVNISDSKSEKSVLNSGSGAVIVENCELGESSVDSGSGFVDLENIVAKNLMVETGSGKVDISGILTGDCGFDSGSGSLNVVVYGNEEDYNISTDMGSGSFYLNGKKKSKDFEKENKRAKYLLEFDVNSGRVSLEFKNR